MEEVWNIFQSRILSCFFALKNIIYIGMGDQIKRYCEKLEPEEYEELLDNEVVL